MSIYGYIFPLVSCLSELNIKLMQGGVLHVHRKLIIFDVNINHKFQRTQSKRNSWHPEMKMFISATYLGKGKDMFISSAVHSP